MTHFDNAELVLGGFRSVRYFCRGVGGKDLTPTSYVTDTTYTQPNKEYRAMCTHGSDDILRRLEKLAPQVFERCSWVMVLREIQLDGRRQFILRRCFDFGYPDHKYEDVNVNIDEIWFSDVSHWAPKKGCTCGFYSFYNLDTEEQYVDPKKKIVGVVENYGRVIHGKLGLRSEKMKILGVAPSDSMIEVPEYFTSIGYPSVDDLLAALPLSKTEGLFND